MRFRSQLDALTFNEHNFEILKEEYANLKSRYAERANAMIDTGNVVRSLFMPYIRRIDDIVRDHKIDPGNAVTAVQDILDELNQHTRIK